MHATNTLRHTGHRTGKVNPAMMIAIVILLAGVAAGAWYFMTDDAPPTDLKIMVDGKEVDPAKFMKDGKINLKDGPTINLANPHEHMAKLVGDYFKLPAGAQRLKYLDDAIDQQEKVRKEMGVSTGPDGVPQLKAGTPTTPSTQPGAAPVRSTIIMRSGGGAAQDSMSPELRAQMAEYMKAMNDRRAARGLAPQQGMMMIRTKQG